MNKKLLFAAMSLAALTACTDNDFESQKVAEEVGSVQFEVLNNNDAFTRASMSTDGKSVIWSAEDADLFTLYHGATVGQATGHQNATYTASLGADGTAVLTTPTMIKAGGAVMVWPVDTMFYYEAAPSAGALSVKIPVLQGGKDEDENDLLPYQIPYVSDEITIDTWAVLDNDPTSATYNEYNSAGKDRKYTVFMRPMASQLNLKAIYTGMDLLDPLAGGDDPIVPIKLTSVDFVTTPAGGTTNFTTEIGLKLTAPGTLGITPGTQWTKANNAWTNVTNFDNTKVVATSNILTTKSLNGNEGCKFLILPQYNITAGNPVDDGGIIVNTIYGKVVIADASGTNPHKSKYNATELSDAWYRYVSSTTTVYTGETKGAAETSGEYVGKCKTTSVPAVGMAQTIDAFSKVVGTDGLVKNEPMGGAATRFVKVLLKYLDMSGLHIKDDKQLRDAARVWKALNLAPVTVYLDGNANKEFEISQQTIAKINEINAGTLNFKVQPCQGITGEVCNRIVIKDGGNVPNIAFIADNTAATFKADVVLKSGQTWTWAGNVDVTATGVAKIINEGTMQNTTGATLKTKENGTAGAQNNVRLENKGTWTVSGGELNVQFDVTNYGTLTIDAGAEYRQAKGSANTTFINEATAVPSRFTLAAAHDDAKIGKVHNSGVFATLAATGSEITNYGEIYHDAEAAKTYITNNQSTSVNFANAFADPANKMGMIILPYNNKDEDNISVKAALNKGFVAVAINADNAPSDGILSATTVGERVNYIKIDGGIHTVADMPASQIKYVEFNSGTTEIDWAVTAAQTYDGMMVLSPVNVKLGTTITVSKATYLGANMYVGGTFNKGSWGGYFGDTSANEATKYITF